MHRQVCLYILSAIYDCGDILKGASFNRISLFPLLKGGGGIPFDLFARIGGGNHPKFQETWEKREGNM